MDGKKVVSCQIVNHGWDDSQYFRGCGYCGTEYDYVATGCGDNAKEAFEDAVEHCYYSDIDHDSLDKVIPSRPVGIRKTDRIPAEYMTEDSDVYWFVSIMLKFAQA